MSGVLYEFLKSSFRREVVGRHVLRRVHPGSVHDHSSYTLPYPLTHPEPALPDQTNSFGSLRAQARVLPPECTREDEKHAKSLSIRTFVVPHPT